MTDKIHKESEDIEALDVMASAADFQTEELKGNSTAYDPVFGVASENGPNYRNVSCPQADIFTRECRAD